MPWSYCFVFDLYLVLLRSTLFDQLLYYKPVLIVDNLPLKALTSMAIKDLARSVADNTKQDRDKKYQFFEYRENVATAPKADVEREEFDFVKVVDLKPDVSALDIIENVDLTNAKEVRKFQGYPMVGWGAFSRN